MCPDKLRKCKYTKKERSFCTSSDAYLQEHFADGLVHEGSPLVECYFVDGAIFVEHSSGYEIGKEVSATIAKLMKELSVVYSNAVFRGITEIEDAGYAFTHVYDFTMAEEAYRHRRNRALVYTVAPNGNKARYPTDVHALPSVEAWMKRLELQGANCIFSVASYNRCLHRQKLPNLQPITVMRTALVGGGMFLLREEGKPLKMLVKIDDHA